MKLSSRGRLRGRPLAGVAAALLGGAAALHLALPPYPSALAQDRPATAGLQAPSFADVVERASPAVVNISVTKTLRPAAGPASGPMPFGRGGPLDEFFGRFFEMPDVPSPPRRSEGEGSGFIIDPEGYVVTNHHVVRGADEVVVTLSDGTQLDAEVVGEDPQMDLALLQLDAGERLPYVQFADSDDVRVGEWVLTIGNPFGLGGSVSAGIVSARGRDIRSGPYDDYLQIDAPINRGNSGGPVFNAGGDVIGVSTAIFSPNGGSVGIGFAIPSNRAAAVIQQLRENGTVERGWLGVQLQRLDQAVAESLGLDSAQGALIADVVPGGPADGAGLESGDVVTRFDGRSIGSVRDLTFAVAEAAPGRRVDVTVLRGGESRTLAVELGTRSEGAAAAPRGSGGGWDRGGEAPLGLRLAPLTERERARLEVPAGVEGVLVAGVRPGSPAAERGLRAGDVVVSVNRRPVASPGEAAAALDAADGSVLLLVRRDGAQHFVAVERDRSP